MSIDTKLAKRKELQALVYQAASEIDSIASEGAKALMQASGMSQEIAVAAAITDLRELMTDTVMKPIMSLMNTDIGFRTDRDPKVKNYKTNEYPEPYPLDVVRNCCIDARLHGLRLIGNEFNIISGRLYIAKAGLQRLVTSFPGLTELAETYGLPKESSGVTVVPCSATYKLHGTPQSIEAEIPVRVNAMMGTDAVIGKAQRKFLRRILDRLRSFGLPDGDVEEVDPKPVQIASTPRRAIGEPPPTPTAEAKTEPPPPPKAVPADSLFPEKPTKAAPREHIPGEKLGQLVETAGFALKDVLAISHIAAYFDGKDGRPSASEIDAWDWLPAKLALGLLGPNGNAAGLISSLRGQASLNAEKTK